MTVFPITVRVTDNQNSYADRDFTLDITNDKVDNFIIVAGGGLARSRDGLTWNIQPGDVYSGAAIAFGDNRWVKVRNLNPMVIDWSDDGVEWNTYDSTVMINPPTPIAYLANIQYNAANAKWYIFGLDLGYNTIYIYSTSDWITFQTLHNAGYGYLLTRYFSHDLIVEGNRILTAFGGSTNGAPSNRTFINVLISEDGGTTWDFRQIRNTFQSSGNPIIPLTSIKKIRDKYYIGMQATGYFGMISYVSYDAINWNEEVQDGAGATTYFVGDLNGALHILRSTSGPLVPTFYSPNSYSGIAPNPVGVIPAGWSLGNGPSLGVLGPSYTGLASIVSAVYNDRYVSITCGGGAFWTPTGSILTIISGDDPFTQATYDDTPKPAFEPIAGNLLINTVGYPGMNYIASRA